MVRWPALCGVVLLAACSAAPPDAIVFALATAPTVLDPRLAGDAASERVNALLYEPLVRLDAEGSARPAMADWERLDPTRYRVRLLPGRLPFWDGRQPVSADVEATYRTLLGAGLGSPHAGALAVIERIEPIDRETLDFVLARPDPGFVERLTIGIAPAQALDGGLAAAPMGSGPFEFLGWRSDGGVMLRRRADSERFALVPVADPTMRVLKLLRGEAHLLQNDLPAELYGHLERQPGVELVEGPGVTFAYLGFNLADPLLGQYAVRRAIAHAVDREAIVRHLFGGRAEPAESVLRPGHRAGVRELPGHRHDPALARAWLARAGHGPERPLRLQYKTSTDPFRLRVAHVLQAQLAEVGIELDIASSEWGTFFADVRAGRFQLYSLAWVGVKSPDILRHAFHSAALPPGGANRGGYRSAAVDALLDAAVAAPAAEAARLYAAAQRQVHADLVYVPLWYEANVAASRGVEGYRTRPDGSYQALAGVRRVAADG
jgi:peptide/nickel transport system substrate-binding protein